jgi:transposase
MHILKLKAGCDMAALKLLWAQTPDRRNIQRLEAIYLRAQGKTPPEIASILGCTPKTVRNWIKRFNAGGPDALKYKHTGGRTAKLDSEQEAALLLFLKQDRPDGRRWTLKALAEKLFEEYGVRLSQQQVSERIKRRGLSQFLSKASDQKRAGSPNQPGPGAARKRGG